MGYRIVNLLQSQSAEEELFVKKINSKLTMDISKNEIVDDDEWIDMVNFTIPYIEKALNKATKQIVTEEEVVKIELIKKVSVESIKHLSKNTNLIAEYDEETEDVIPSKILNAYKEESFITYENRFLYTLVKLIDDFIYLRTEKEDKNEYKGKNKQKAVYEATAKKRKEKITLNFEYLSETEEGKERTEENARKLSQIKKGMIMVKATEMYKYLDAKRVTLVKSPLKMTNVLLKNVNFQYAVKLWSYLNSHLDTKNKAIRNQKDYEEKGLTKELIDEDFFIKYLIFNNMNSQIIDNKRLINVARDPKEQKELTDKLIEKILDLNPELTDKELKQMIADKYLMYKIKRDVSLKPLEDVFKKSMNTYMQKIEKLRLR